MRFGLIVALAAVSTLFSTPSGLGADMRATDMEGRCSSQLKVALDIGHTLAQPGATSASGATEFAYNRRLARAVGERLKELAIGYLLIGDEGTSLGLEQRTRLAHAAGADLFLSLHHDSVQPRYLSSWTINGGIHAYSDVFRGYSIFISSDGPRGPENLRFASGLGSALREGGFAPSLHHAAQIEGEGRKLIDVGLGIYRFDQLVVLRTATMPAALLEAGIIVNRQEEEALNQPMTLQRLVTAISHAVQAFCVSSAQPLNRAAAQARSRPAEP